MLLYKQLQHEANLAKNAADAQTARANRAKAEAAAAEKAKAAAGFAAAEKEAKDELKKATENVSETFAAKQAGKSDEPAADGDKQASKSDEPARDHGSTEEGYNASSKPFAFGAQDEKEPNYPSRQHSTRAKSKQAEAAKLQRQNKSVQEQKARREARMNGARNQKNVGKGA
jgi:colicin import membrane protein